MAFWGHASFRMVWRDLFLSWDDEIFILFLIWRLFNRWVEVSLHGRQEWSPVVLSGVGYLLLLGRVVYYYYIVSYVLHSAVNYYLLVVVIVRRHPLAILLVRRLRLLLLLLRWPLLLGIWILLRIIHRIILIWIILVVKRHLVIGAPHRRLHVLIVLQGGREHIVGVGALRHQIAIDQSGLRHQEFVVNIISWRNQSILSSFEHTGATLEVLFVHLIKFFLLL